MEILLNPKIFRPGSKVDSYRTVNFVIHEGGIGDYIGYLSAIFYIASNHPQVIGHVYCPDHFKEIAENVLSSFIHWRVLSFTSLTEETIKKYPTYGPYNRPINITGAHMVDLGFMYYLNINPPPKDWNYYPKLNLEDLGFLPRKDTPYAVLTPGATTENRTMPVRTMNEIAEYCEILGLTPVWLGKKKVGKREIKYQDYDYHRGIDLRDQTTLIEAAQVIKQSKFIVGLDNGLLHLAAMTETPIIFGYNIASPEHRMPRRKIGDIYNIYPDEEKLTCTFCQSKMRMMFNHNFNNCMYNDNRCLDYLADPFPWHQAIKKIILKV